VVSCHIKPELAGFRGFRRFSQKSYDLRRVQRLENASRVESLMKNRERIAACNDYTCWQIDCVVKAVYGRGCFALENTAERLIDSVHLKLNHFLARNQNVCEGNELQPALSIPHKIDARSPPLIAVGTQMRTFFHLENHRRNILFRSFVRSPRIDLKSSTRCGQVAASSRINPKSLFISRIGNCGL
jgi:hypothetical protein